MRLNALTARDLLCRAALDHATTLALALSMLGLAWLCSAALQAQSAHGHGLWLHAMWLHVMLWSPVVAYVVWLGRQWIRVDLPKSAHRPLDADGCLAMLKLAKRSTCVAVMLHQINRQGRPVCHGDLEHARAWFRGLDAARRMAHSRDSELPTRAFEQINGLARS